MIVKEILSEVVQSDTIRYDPTKDVVDVQSLSDTRKPKLTLQMLNNLKKMRAAKSLEIAQKKNKIKLVYGIPPETTDI